MWDAEGEEKNTRAREKEEKTKKEKKKKEYIGTTVKGTFFCCLHRNNKNYYLYT